CADLSRVVLPREIYPVSAGVTGRRACGGVMALRASAYVILSGNGIWYAMNLLSAGFFPGAATETAVQIGVFKLHDLLVATPIHLVISLRVGLLYGALLRLRPSRPIFLGGPAAPLMWCCPLLGVARSL